jgi:hypothetical protein
MLFDSENEAIERVNKMKEEHGNGVCTLVMIHNTLGEDLNLKSQKDTTHNWSGHMGKYPADKIIPDNKWSVFLHVHTSGTAKGSVAAILYSMATSSNIVFFICWATPWNRAANKPKVYVNFGKLEGEPDWDSIKGSLSSSNQYSSHSECSITIEGSIGDDSSPLASYVVIRNPV